MNGLKAWACVGLAVFLASAVGSATWGQVDPAEAKARLEAKAAARSAVPSSQSADDWREKTILQLQTQMLQLREENERLRRELSEAKKNAPLAKAPAKGGNPFDGAVTKGMSYADAVKSMGSPYSDTKSSEGVRIVEWRAVPFGTRVPMREVRVTFDDGDVAVKVVEQKNDVTQ